MTSPEDANMLNAHVVCTECGTRWTVGYRAGTTFVAPRVCSNPDCDAGRKESRLHVGDRVVITRGPFVGETGVLSFGPGRVFIGWAVKLDSGRICGAGGYEMEKEPA